MKISDKHGLNPTIDVCFFCGNDKQIILLGKLKGDVKAPGRIVSGYEPCKDCRKKMRLGVTVIEVTNTDNGAAPMRPGVWPTGRWCVLKRRVAGRLFDGIAGFDSTTQDKLLLDDKVYERLINHEVQ